MKEYTIKRNKHTSRPRLIRPYIFRKGIEFEFVLDKSNWYPSIEHDGINKICGISFGIHAEQPFGKIPIIKNLVNSCIVGWRPDFDNEGWFRINIINDNRGVETRPLWLMRVKADEVNKVRIEKTDGGCFLTLNDGIRFFPMNTPNFGYLLGYYHGGKVLHHKK